SPPRPRRGARPRRRASARDAPAALAGWAHLAARAAQSVMRGALRRAAYTIHRADLLSVIATAFPAERVHLGHRLVGLVDRGDGAEAWFDNGVRITPDVLVGADGIHSAVHAALFGKEAPDFAGCVAYRGLVPAERIATLGLELGNQSWVGPGAHFVHYFVSRRRLPNFGGW